MLVRDTQEQRNTVLASYVARLRFGATRLAISIKVGTIKLYIKAVVDILKMKKT